MLLAPKFKLRESLPQYDAPMCSIRGITPTNMMLLFALLRGDLILCVFQDFSISRLIVGYMIHILILGFYHRKHQP